MENNKNQHSFMEKKKEYVAPQLTVVSFKVEMGFTASNPILDQIMFWGFGPSEQIEDYSEHSVWNNDEGFWN